MPKFKVWLPEVPTPGHHFTIQETPNFDTLRKRWKDAIHRIRTNRQPTKEKDHA